MRSLLTLAKVGLLIATCLASQTAQAASGVLDDLASDGVLRVSFGWAKSRNNNYATKVIGGLSYVQSFGVDDRHEINLEYLWSAWQTSFYDYNGNFVARHTVVHHPILINYRCHVPVPRTPCAFHLGGGIGLDIMGTSSTSKDNNSRNRKDSDTDFALAVVASAGAIIRFTQRLGLEFSYRCLWQSASTYTGNPVTNPGTGKTSYTGTRPDVVNMALCSMHWAF